MMAETMAEPKSEEAAAAAALSELTALLSPSSPAAPAAAEAALALSGSASGRAMLAGHPEALAALAASASRGSAAALGALVNASSEAAALEPLLAALPSLVPLLASSGGACGVLANLCRAPGAGPAVLRALGPGAEALLPALRAERPPEELGALLWNLSRERMGREMLMERSGGNGLRRAARRLLELLRDPERPELRRGAAGALRNCCFQHEHHEWLLSSEVDALPFLLLPLAGPRELSPEETELPKIPEFPQLSATKRGRSHLRSNGSYPVLRELHQQEKNPEVLGACQKLIEVLIGDEPEVGMENLLEVTIPEELERRFREEDEEEEERRRKEREREEEETSR
ncbi:PREDICTED: protein HGH1 homolog [Pseudopodoces humilis]|uniref:protein HGH1 homolog n=1 Tax=Pseudopodoces humilis TaxID=181119 RepID=UPI0006B78C6F|nr:PREDICTED: protein HGH1 homolog [Pseudopodoces humilis]